MNAIRTTESGERDISFQFSSGRRQCLLGALPQLLMLPTLGLPVWWPYWPWVTALGAILIWQLLRQLASQGRMCRERIIGLGWEDDDAFNLRLVDGRVVQAVMLSGAIVHPRFLALRFRDAEGRVYRLLQPVSRDAMAHLAPLRRHLLHSRAAHGGRSSPSA